MGNRFGEGDMDQYPNADQVNKRSRAMHKFAPTASLPMQTRLDKIVSCAVNEMRERPISSHLAFYLSSECQAERFGLKRASREQKHTLKESASIKSRTHGHTTSTQEAYLDRVVHFRRISYIFPKPKSCSQVKIIRMLLFKEERENYEWLFWIKNFLRPVYCKKISA